MKLNMMLLAGTVSLMVPQLVMAEDQAGHQVMEAKPEASAPQAIVLSAAEQKQTDEIKAALQHWLATVATRNVTDIAALYAPDAVLLPTVAPGVHDMPEERTQYFTHFTEKADLKGRIDEEHVRLLGKDAAVDSGLYTFSFTKNGQTYNVPARYTFVFKKTGEKWMIAEHHSSKTPE